MISLDGLLTKEALVAVKDLADSKDSIFPDFSRDLVDKTSTSKVDSKIFFLTFLAEILAADAGAILAEPAGTFKLMRK